MTQCRVTLVKFVFDFFPLLAFFVAFKMTDESASGIYIATATLLFASFLQIGAYRLLYKRFENMHLITFAVLLLFGGATLLLQDERFIKWKPSVVLWIFAVAVIASQYMGRYNIFQRMIQYADKSISVPTKIWSQLNFSLAIFLILLGGLNLYVAYYFDRALWVDFKVFGITILNCLFIGSAVFYLSRHAQIVEPEHAERPGE